MSKKLKDQLIKLGSKRKDLRPHIRPVLAEIDKIAGLAPELDLIHTDNKILVHATVPGTAMRVSGVQKNAKIMKSAIEDALEQIIAELGQGRAYVDELSVSGQKNGGLLYSTPAGSTAIHNTEGISVEDLEEAVANMKSNRTFGRRSITVESY